MTYEWRYQYGEAPSQKWITYSHDCDPRNMSLHSRFVNLEKLPFEEINKLICPGCKHFIPSWLKKQIKIRFVRAKYET
jgi:hypothetical protein